MLIYLLSWELGPPMLLLLAANLFVLVHLFFIFTDMQMQYSSTLLLLLLIIAILFPKLMILFLCNLIIKGPTFSLGLGLTH